MSKLFVCKNGGSLLDPFNVVFSIIGIGVLFFLFLVSFSNLHEPGKNIGEAQTKSSGDLFLSTYLDYPLTFDNQQVTMEEALIIFYQTRSENYKDIIMESTSNIMKKVYFNNPNPCFFISFQEEDDDSIKNLIRSFNCENVPGFKGSTFLPYKNKKLIIEIRGVE